MELLKDIFKRFFHQDKRYNNPLDNYSNKVGGSMIGGIFFLLPSFF
jgi:hypothetical protein